MVRVVDTGNLQTQSVEPSDAARHRADNGQIRRFPPFTGLMLVKIDIWADDLLVNYIQDDLGFPGHGNGRGRRGDSGYSHGSGEESAGIR